VVRIIATLLDGFCFPGEFYLVGGPLGKNGADAATNSDAINLTAEADFVICEQSIELTNLL
jgi:hypothetical protein